MSPSRSHIHTVTMRYLDRHPEEREALSGLLLVLGGPGDPSGRATLPGHVTCCAAVTDRHFLAVH